MPEGGQRSRILADENIPGSVVARLRDAGLDVLWVSEYSPSIDDPQVLELARVTERALLTLDSDFGGLIFFQHRPFPPRVLYLRLFPILTDLIFELALRAVEEVPEGMFAVVTEETTRLRRMERH